MDSELGEVGYAVGHPIVEIYVGRDRKADERGGREGGSEIQWRDRSNREHGFRDSCFTARCDDKARARGQSS